MTYLGPKAVQIRPHGMPLKPDTPGTRCRRPPLRCHFHVISACHALLIQAGKFSRLRVSRVLCSLARVRFRSAYMCHGMMGMAASPHSVAHTRVCDGFSARCGIMVGRKAWQAPPVCLQRPARGPPSKPNLAEATKAHDANMALHQMHAVSTSSAG